MTENESNKDLESINNSDENESEFKDILPNEIFEAIPEEDRGRVASIIKQTMISGVTRKSNPISDKITPEHITLLISKSDNQDKRDRDERKGERNYNLILIILALVFVGFIIIFLQSNEELLLKVILVIVSFVGGFGFGQSRKKKPK